MLYPVAVRHHWLAEPERRVWAAAIGVTLCLAAARSACLWLCGVPIPWMPATPTVAALSAVTLLAGCCYLWHRGEDDLATPLLGLGMLLGGSIAANEASDLPFYLGRGYALVDAELSGYDTAAGFCWRCYAGWLDAHPALYWFGDQAYQTIVIQAPVTVIGLAWCRLRMRLCGFLMAWNVSMVLTSIVAYRFPALGAYTFYGVSAADHPHIAMLFSDDMRGTIAWLREGRFAAFPDGLIAGLISFPSFHGAMAVVYVWAAWPTVFRWPVLALNAAMVAVTPIDGSHYLTDILAGFGVGIIGVCATNIGLAWVARHSTTVSSRPLARHFLTRRPIGHSRAGS